MTSRTVLVVAERFGGRLSAAAVAEAVGSGLRAGDPTLEVNLCPLDDPGDREQPAADRLATLRKDLDALGLETRMRQARALAILTARLDRETLVRGGAVFEIATRARQGGVPCYAVAKHIALDLFEARILDLQVVLEAGDRRELVIAGRKLAGIV